MSKPRELYHDDTTWVLKTTYTRAFKMLQTAMLVIAVLKEDNQGSNKTMGDRIIEQFDREYPDGMKDYKP